MRLPLHSAKARGLVHHPSYSRRTISSGHLIRILRKNEELDEEDAANEVRWILQAVQERRFPKARADADGRSRDSIKGPKSRGSPDSQEEEAVLTMVERRARGEPLQYILGMSLLQPHIVADRAGTEEFGPLTLKCAYPTLIPRPETAYITKRLSQRIQACVDRNSTQLTQTDRLRIHDVCTGSGCIPLLLCHYLPASTISGSDLSPEAVDLACQNAVETGLDVSFDISDVMSDKHLGKVSQASIDTLVSNPPYIPVREWEALDPSVKSWEDPRALIGDPEDLPASHLGVREGSGSGSDGKGLAFYRRIAAVLPTYLTPKCGLGARGLSGLPRVAVEVGLGQAEDVASIFQSHSQGLISRTEVWDDQFGVPRMVVGFDS